MKYLHFSDIHGDVETTREVLNWAHSQSGLETVLCTGDLVGPKIKREDLSKFSTYTKFLIESGAMNGAKNLEEFYANANSHKDPKVRDTAKKYQKIEKQFMEESLQTYQELREVFTEEAKRGTRVLTIPGNWDNFLYFNIMRDFDLDGRLVELDGLKFVGYGGADPPIGPVYFSIPYLEEQLEEVLEKVDADVILTHTPPQYTVDGGLRALGSKTLKEYIRKKQPKAVFSGHIHGHGRHARVGKTLVNNSGNLGQHLGKGSFGNFSVVEINPEGKSNSTHYQLREGKVIELSKPKPELAKAA